MKTQPGSRKTAFLTAAFLALICLASLLYLLLPTRNNTEYTADIAGETCCVNEIEVRPGSIGIISADCPDKLCVGQGFISDTRLPVTCLPNRLVIQLRPVSGTAEDTAVPDIISY